MALFSKKGESGNVARKTFEWENSNKGENIMYKYPRNIQWNDNVIVKEDEYAVFFRDGKALHVFDRPGRFALTTQNVPVLGTLGSAVTGVRQLGEIYYIQKREMRGKFGTAEPLAFRDVDFGVVRIRVFGDFSYKVLDPLLFISQFVGTENVSSSQEVLDWAKKQMVMGINDMLGELKRDKNMAILDFPAYLQEMEQIILSKIESDMARYGIKIAKIANLNINMPKEIQDAIDKKGAMGALGVDYMQYQTGKAVEGIGEGAAKGGAGGAGAFASMGAGFGMGAGMANNMSKSMQGQTEAPDFSKPKVEKAKCAKCGAEINKDAKFCRECGAKVISEEKMTCPKCGVAIRKDAKFCPECGMKMTSNCPKCNASVKAGVKFCPECGEKIESEE